MYKGSWAIIMAACVGDGPYMMPDAFLPDADCEHCKYMALPHDGGHCYMFERKPGEKCGQFAST
jgi:hypothetical protein